MCVPSVHLLARFLGISGSSGGAMGSVRSGSVGGIRIFRRALLVSCLRTYCNVTSGQRSREGWTALAVLPFRFGPLPLASLVRDSGKERAGMSATVGHCALGGMCRDAPHACR